MKLSLTPAAEQDLVQGALFYTRAATARLGQAFISEFERSAGLLIEQPGLGAIWRGINAANPAFGKAAPSPTVHKA